jgi:hypothetical protein
MSTVLQLTKDPVGTDWHWLVLGEDILLLSLWVFPAQLGDHDSRNPPGTGMAFGQNINKQLLSGLNVDWC